MASSPFSFLWIFKNLFLANGFASGNRIDG